MSVRCSHCWSLERPECRGGYTKSLFKRYAPASIRALFASDSCSSGLQVWLGVHGPQLRSAVLEQRLWTRTLPRISGANSKSALLHELANGYKAECHKVCHLCQSGGWVSVHSRRVSGAGRASDSQRLLKEDQVAAINLYAELQ